MSRIARWRVLWLVVLALVVGLEVWAIVDGVPGNTISENTWTLLGLSWLLWVWVVGFLVWLLIHIGLPKVRDWWRRKPWR